MLAAVEEEGARKKSPTCEDIEIPTTVVDSADRKKVDAGHFVELCAIINHHVCDRRYIRPAGGSGIR